MKKILVGGRFNVIHPGHVQFLKMAKKMGDRLVVVLANDVTVKNNKKALLFPAKDRKSVLESLSFVDKVIIGQRINSQEGYIKIIRKEKPDIVAMGYDQNIKTNDLIKLVSDEGIEIKFIRISKFKNYQTKKLLKNI